VLQKITDTDKAVSNELQSDAEVENNKADKNDHNDIYEERIHLESSSIIALRLSAAELTAATAPVCTDGAMTYTAKR
jgi:hypothetical protein